MKNSYITLILIIIFAGCKSDNIDISRITVLDSDFKIIHVIDKPELIKEVNEIWKDFQPIDDLPTTQWTHKIDIESKKLNGRWLYNKEGFIAYLNYQLKPRYKVVNKRAFNKIVLGFKQGSL